MSFGTAKVRQADLSSDRDDPVVHVESKVGSPLGPSGIAGQTNCRPNELAILDEVEPGVTIADIEWECNERFLPLRRALGVGSFGLNQITLQPGQRGRIHRHRDQEEVYLVLRGTLTVACEREEHELGEGQLLRVAPDVRRQLVNAGHGPCVVVAIGGAGEHVGRDGEAFAAWSETEGRPPQEVPLPDDLPRA
jgi:quercetin dioxygenase-like cupin family protein